MNINVKKWTLYILLSVLFVDILLIIFFHETILTIISGSTTIKKEPIYIENYKGKTLSDDAWIEAMHKYPILIERPIVINGNKAVVARPPEKVHEIL